MNGIQQFFSRWKTDYDFKTVAGAFGSLAVTAVFALYNGFLGIYHASLWHGTICVYYLVLVVLRGLLLLAGRRLSPQSGRESAHAQKKVYSAAAALLLLLNVCLVLPVSLMVVRQKPVSMTLIPAIAMAAYTTYKVVMASIHLKQRKRSANGLVRLLRTISFIEALVSILTLQNTLIMVNSTNVDNMLPFTAMTSGVVWAVVLCLSATAIIYGVARLRKAS